MKRDLRVYGAGSVYLVYPVSEAGKKWLEETAPEDAQFLGDAMAVEHRYIAGVVEAAREAGLEMVED